MTTNSNSNLATTAKNMDNLKIVIDLIVETLERKSKINDAYTLHMAHFSKSNPNNGTLGKKSLKLINDCLGSHRFDEAAKLAWILCQDRSCFTAILYKCMMVVFENLQFEDKNEIIMKFSSDIQDQISINKLDVQLEYLIYALRNNVTDIQDSYEKITSKRKRVKLKKIPVIEHVLDAYCAVLDYITWRNSFQDALLTTHSKNVADKAIAGMKSVIEHPGSWDIFIIKLVEMLEHYEEYEEIEKVLKKYVKCNPKHINAYIYLCLHLHKYSTDQNEFIQYTKELAMLCPSDIRVLLLVQTWNEQGKNLEECLKILFMYLDYPINGKSKLGWQMLSLNLCQAIESHKSRIIKHVKSLWSFRCHVWSYMHFNLSNIKSAFEDDPELLAYKVKVISALEPGHPYIKKAMKRISHLQKCKLDNYKQACAPAEDFHSVYKLDDDINTRECL